MNDKTIYPEKKNKEKQSIIVMIAILLIIIMVIIGFIISGTNKAIIKRSFSQINKKVNYYNEIINGSMLNKEEYKLEGTITPNIKIDSKDTLNTGFDVDKLNDSKIDYIINKDKDDASLNYKILINDEVKATLKAILKDNENYLNLGDNWSKLADENMINKDDINYLKDVILKSLTDSIDSELYTSEKENITIDGEKIKAKKVTVTLKDEDLYKSLNSILKDLRDDKKANKILKNEDINLSDVKLNKEDFEGYKLTYSVYKKSTYGKYLAFSLNISDSNDNKASIIYKSNENDEIQININNFKILINVKKEKNKFTAKLNINEQEVATLKYSIQDFKENLSLSTYLSYNLDIVLNNEYKKKDGKYNLNGNYSILIKYNNQIVLDASIKNKGTLTNKADKIEKPKDVSEFNSSNITDFLNPIISEYIIN